MLSIQPFRARVLVRIAPLAALVAGAACSDAVGANAKTVSLSFAATTPAAPAASLAPLARLGTSSVTVTSGANTLVITKAQVVLRKVELTQSSSATCAGTSDDGCETVVRGPLLVELPLTGATGGAITVAVPAGTYRELQLEIHRVETGDSLDVAFLQTHPGFQGVSIRLEGTFNGQPFVYQSRVDIGLEMVFATPVAVDRSGMNVTLNVDLSTWFRDGNGALLDPATAAVGQPNESVVADNIKLSFHAFEDENHDGRDDH